MSHYSYLHIALRGEIQGATRTIYSYPASGSDIDPCWNSTMVRARRSLSKRFLNASEMLYTPVISPRPLFLADHTQHRQPGTWLHDDFDTRRKRLRTHRPSANERFSQLKKVLIEDENLSDEAVDDALSQAGIPSEPLRLEAWKYHTPDESAPLAEAASVRISHSRNSNRSFRSLASLTTAPTAA